MKQTREEYLARRKRYYYKNRKKLLWQKKNKHYKKHYSKYRQKYIDRAKIWKKNNPEKVKESRRKYDLLHPNASKEWQEKRMKQVYAFFGNKCSKCGFKGVYAFQLHHKNGQKDRRRDWFKLDYDLDRLTLLCANCHCLIHYKKKYGTKK